MKAITFHGVSDVRVESVADPKVVDPGDVVVRVTTSAVCGSDLHQYHGRGGGALVQTGAIMGHEFMGVIEDVGLKVKRVAKGDRVVVPSFIVCGQCWYCQQHLFSLCDNTHPKPELQEPLLGGYPTAGIYGYTHAFGGYAGAHA
jgi:threonine dehydrogenase-like Zn-dependent dehydrogenase